MLLDCENIFFNSAKLARFDSSEIRQQEIIVFKIEGIPFLKLIYWRFCFACKLFTHEASQGM